ncbi:LacI family DNA-binding transcriptional regulator [Rathayibacter sp. VKM Ac-2857]|uniref:LacI family DNA-binding transcriptional regulator n=1 Tax=Rathayibacter sp. VKM Ac-2857 TaxID=2739020 RepID=UPI001563491B|nr:LacI family DNA-binding transcriptional regulator [Rathayibacter sp. VKM Ac-2857]
MTAYDVAVAAGVSKTTVSYVLNDSPGQTIPMTTRSRVLQAVRDLGYVPSSTARALRTGRDNSVLLVLPDWPLSGAVSAVIEGLLDELEKHGLALKTRRETSSSPFRNDWVHIAPQAVVALHELDPDQERRLRGDGILVAHALLAAPQGSGQSATFPQERIGGLQVQHLVSRGRRRLGYVAPRDARVATFSGLRVDGARETAAELGVEDLLVEHIDPSRDEATALLRRWTASATKVTGIAAYNDHFAAALLAAARDLRIDVPGDLSVIGVDNDHLSEFTSPPLTTIDQHSNVVARHLSALILAGIAGRQGDAGPSQDLLSLVVRSSS